MVESAFQVLCSWCELDDTRANLTDKNNYGFSPHYACDWKSLRIKLKKCISLEMKVLVLLRFDCKVTRYDGKCNKNLQML